MFALKTILIEWLFLPVGIIKKGLNAPGRRLFNTPPCRSQNILAKWLIN